MMQEAESNVPSATQRTEKLMQKARADPIPHFSGQTPRTLGLDGPFFLGGGGDWVCDSNKRDQGHRHSAPWNLHAEIHKRCRCPSAGGTQTESVRLEVELNCQASSCLFSSVLHPVTHLYLLSRSGTHHLWSGMGWEPKTMQGAEDSRSPLYHKIMRAKI